MKKIFTHHPLMKLLALSLSIALWWFVRSERQNEKTVDIPVSYTSVPKSLVHSGTLQETIRLRLRGSQSKLAKVDKNYFANHTIDLSSAKSGPNSFWLYEEDFRLPFGVYVTQIFPQAIRVVLEPKKNRLIPIRPRYTGELPPGIDIQDVRIEPGQVSFESFQEELDKVEYFYTQPIALDGKMKDFSGEYFVDVGTSKGLLDTEKVKVIIDLVEKEISETIPSVPIVLPNQLAKFQTEPETVELIVQGPLSQVLKVVKNPPDVTVDTKSLQAAGENASILLKVKNVGDVRIKVSPKQVQLTSKGGGSN